MHDMLDYEQEVYYNFKPFLDSKSLDEDEKEILNIFPFNLSFEHPWSFVVNKTQSINTQLNDSNSKPKSQRSSKLGQQEREGWWGKVRLCNCDSLVKSQVNYCPVVVVYVKLNEGSKCLKIEKCLIQCIFFFCACSPELINRDDNKVICGSHQNSPYPQNHFSYQT